MTLWLRLALLSPLIDSLSLSPSLHFPLSHTSRSKRYAIEGSFWGVKIITYRITRGCSSLSDEQLKQVFRRAFETWEEYTQLKFVYKEKGDVHIEVMFMSGAHGDGEPFDGPGKILAHAYFPRYGGDLHFDDDEMWSMDKSGPGLDLYAVAVHEIGHSLGLKHSHEVNAIMAPYYQTYTGDQLHLHHDDLSGLDRLYGPSGAANQGHKIVSNVPDICQNGHIDAITKLFNGSLYAFQGNYFWKLSEETGVERGYPRVISDYWPVEGPYDAVMTNSHGLTYIFKEDVYYLLDKFGQRMKGYPRKIEKGLEDMPDRIDAALTWHFDEKPYFFKKDKYWKYSRFGMPSTWPKPISLMFKGKAPSKIDAGLRLSSNSTYIFSGRKYWRLGGFRNMKVMENYPRSIAEYWFHCNGRHHLQK